MLSSVWLQGFIIIVAIFALYVLYHSFRVYQFLKAHEKYVAAISERAKQRKYDTIPSWLNFSYDDIITQQQFDTNMKYFEANRDKNGGFFGTGKPEGDLLAMSAESCAFLGGARAALLQLAHPMLSAIYIEIYMYEQYISNNIKQKRVAISVKKHSYIIKRSKSNKDVEQDRADIVNDCDINLLSKALKMRFNRTFAIMFPIVFGPLKYSFIAAKKAWTVHKTINGFVQNKDDKEIIGDGKIFNSDTYYKATMVLTVRWVWATLVEGSLFTLQMMGIQSYDQNDEQTQKLIEEGYKLTMNTAMAFGLRKDQVPPTYEEFEEYYFYHMMQSDHIVVCNDCAKWCNVFFMANTWYMKPLLVALHCYTALLFPKIVREKFNKFDKNLLPLNGWRYIYGLLWMGLSRGVYRLLPLRFRYLNNYINLRQRADGKRLNVLERLMKLVSGYAADHVVRSFIEG